MLVGHGYTATAAQIGASHRWGKACLGVMTTFALNLMWVCTSWAGLITAVTAFPWNESTSIHVYVAFLTLGSSTHCAAAGSQPSCTSCKSTSPVESINA